MAKRSKSCEFILDIEQLDRDAPVVAENIEDASDRSETHSTRSIESSSVGEEYVRVEIGESSATSDAESSVTEESRVEIFREPNLQVVYSTSRSRRSREAEKNMKRAVMAARYAREAAESTWIVMQNIEIATGYTETRVRSTCYKIEALFQRKHEDEYRLLQNRHRLMARDPERIGREVTDAHYDAEQAADAVDKVVIKLSNATDLAEMEAIVNAVLPVIYWAEDKAIQAFEKEYIALKILKEYLRELSTPGDWQEIDNLCRCHSIDKCALVFLILGSVFIIASKESEKLNLSYGDSVMTLVVGIIFVVAPALLSLARFVHICVKLKFRLDRKKIRKEIALMEKRLRWLRDTYGSDERAPEIRPRTSNDEA